MKTPKISRKIFAQATAVYQEMEYGPIQDGKWPVHMAPPGFDYVKVNGVIHSIWGMQRITPYFDTDGAVDYTRAFFLANPVLVTSGVKGGDIHLKIGTNYMTPGPVCWRDARVSSVDLRTPETLLWWLGSVGVRLGNKRVEDAPPMLKALMDYFNSACEA